MDTNFAEKTLKMDTKLAEKSLKMEFSGIISALSH